MDARFRRLSPALTLSTHASRSLGLATLAHIASAAKLDGLDVDLSQRLLTSPSRAATAAERHRVPIRSVWEPHSASWAIWRQNCSIDPMTILVQESGAALLVVALPPGGERQRALSLNSSSMVSLRTALPPNVRLCLAVRSKNLEGGRSHLVELTALRRLSEEWDFGIALDLTGHIDPRWEAEAAIARLSARLRLVRLGTDVATGSTDVNSRMATRALSAVVDAGHPIEFALVPRLPLWRWDRGRAMTEACEGAARRIRARYSSIEAERIADTVAPPPPRRHGQRPA